MPIMIVVDRCVECGDPMERSRFGLCEGCAIEQAKKNYEDRKEREGRADEA